MCNIYKHHLFSELDEPKSPAVAPQEEEQKEEEGGAVFEETKDILHNGNDVHNGGTYQY